MENKGNKFKLKDSYQNTKQDNKSSKYFKPGFIYNNKAKSNEDSDLELSDVEDLEEIISQSKYGKASTSNQKSIVAATATESKPSTSLNSVSERVNQVASQAVNFTAKNVSAGIPSLKGNNIILVNSNQKQNPLLQNLRSARYVINDSIAPAHYLLSDSCCALFLSLKYHVIHPNYVYERIKELQGKYQLKILLVMIDHIIYEKSLKELTLLAVKTNFTMMLAWTYEEAAKHIENYRINSDKPPDLIMGRSEDSSTKSSTSAHQQSLIDALTTVKAVNRTDATTLLTAFESFDNLTKANTDELTICPGISMVKARRLHAMFNKPFIKTDTDYL